MAETDQNPLTKTYAPAKTVQNEAHISSMEQYREMYKQSVEDPEQFWGKVAENFHWRSKPTGKFLDYNFDVRKGPISIKWMEGAVTNVCYNMLDLNIEKGLGDNVAFYW